MRDKPRETRSSNCKKPEIGVVEDDAKDIHKLTIKGVRLKGSEPNGTYLTITS
jgi:hypothetical protein